MTETEIEESIEAFAQAARRAREAGVDGIELFAACHALIDQFWTPWSNRRDDRWGGSRENRLRFSTEIIARIRKLVGEDFIVGIAVSMDPDAPAALSMESLQKIVAWHDTRELIDYVTCATDSYFDPHDLIPTFPYPDKLGPPYAEALKQAVKHARVQAESHIRTPENGDYAIASGQADMVGIVRGQIADAHLANKARHGRAKDIRPKDIRPEDIRPCISCNQLCWGRHRLASRRAGSRGDPGHAPADGRGRAGSNSADWALRQRLATLGVETLTDAAVSEWHGDGTTVVNLLDDSTRRVDCDALVLATINVAETTLGAELAGSDLEVHHLEDCVAPRRANNATFQGRKLGLKL